jgi:isoleucyl-tRNA synthetase
MAYPLVHTQPSFPTIERDILQRWDADGTFQASIDQREGADEYVFYDGPPFANGLPHYGHLLTGFVKDAVPRYRTMRGQQVHRRFGWDCHGLPAEVVAEKELGISGHPEITRFGIDKFNDACRTSVLRFTDDWHRYVTRQARWVDFENDYKTLDTSYMESVMWAFKTLWDKGLVYEGFRVLAYCWRCETPLSNHELRMDDEVYKNRQDQTVTVTFPVLDGQGFDGVKLLAWTTTPWTLPTNFALAVGPTIEYAVVNGYLLAKSLVGAHIKELGFETTEDALAAVSRTLKGSELKGLRYEPIFDFYRDETKFEVANAWQVLVDDYV